LISDDLRLPYIVKCIICYSFNRGFMEEIQWALLPLWHQTSTMVCCRGKYIYV